MVFLGKTVNFEAKKYIMQASYPKINNWVNDNKEMLRAHRGKWIAYNETGLIASELTLDAVCKSADIITNDYIVYFVNPYMFGVRFRPIHFRSISFHDWQPLYPINLRFKEKSIQLNMLIDSGADGSLISYKTGLSLGLTVGEGETRQEAKGIGGGKLQYVWRDIIITINDHSITAPVAWILEGSNQEEIIGRQVIFDKFDIEFKQADEQIIFKYRGDKTADVS